MATGHTESVKRVDKLAWQRTFAMLDQIRHILSGKSDPMKFYPYEKVKPQEDKPRGVPLTRGNVVQLLGAALGVKT